MLSHSNFTSYDISCYSTISALTSLIYLVLLAIPLQDSGMLVLCGSLVHHCSKEVTGTEIQTQFCLVSHSQLSYTDTTENKKT